MIQFNDVASQWQEISNETHISEDIEDFLQHGPYILGEQVKRFESEFAKYCGANYAVGISSGTDALKLAIQALLPLLPSDTEILIPANAHISSMLAPAYFNRKTILIDCDQNHNIDIEQIAGHCNACDKHHLIIATHMYGHPVDIPKIKTFKKSTVIEDCSHAHGATIDGQHVGTFGDIGIFSLYPTKNLGAVGDAGIIITNNENRYSHLMSLRNYGQFEDDYNDIGWNNRLDEIQALILNEKLEHLDKWNDAKFVTAKLYDTFLTGIGDLVLPKLTNGRVFHIYQIRTTRRDQLRAYLKEKDIPTLIHYPRPLHETELFSYLKVLPKMTPRTDHYAKEILSLPMHPYLTKKDTTTIAATIEEFFETYSCAGCGGHEELMEHTDKLAGTYICRWCARKAAGKIEDIINPTGRYRPV